MRHVFEFSLVRWIVRLVTSYLLHLGIVLPVYAGQPNLLIIQTDEHHYNTLGCYGGKIVETPHIDRLAEEGALCSSFYATTPVCSPSRGALVTGRYPQHNHVVQNNIPLAEDMVTFAEVLKRQDYKTGFIGKWHLDGDGKPQWEPERKFGFEDNRFMFNRGHWKKFEMVDGKPQVGGRNQKGQPSYDVDEADEKTFSTDFLTDRAIEFMADSGSSPFCLMLSLPDPHGPNTVREPYDSMYDDVEVPIPSTIRKDDAQIPAWAPSEGKLTVATLRRLMPNYFGMVKCIDDNVGRMLAFLEQSGKLDQTVIVFTSDHGDLCGEHGRLNKGNPYEGSARIPFLLRYPSKVAGGTRIDVALSCVDFMPTVFSLMGVEDKTPRDGRDASSWFEGKSSVDWKDQAYLRSTMGQRWLCVVSDRFKLVYANDERPWLMDLEKDPEEAFNHIQHPEYASVVRGLTQGLLDYCEQQQDPYGRNPEIRQSMLEALH
ncbi:MAG: sulfatase [Verrucomicrobia bacterium]|jgi:arylsulfatase A-like enzyme|nr:sulfatase [Verrucomicrobiota bacterium]